MRRAAKVVKMASDVVRDGVFGMPTGPLPEGMRFLGRDHANGVAPQPSISPAA